MRKYAAYVAITIVLLLGAFSILQNTYSQSYTDKWFNGSWNYRVRVDINASNSTRVDWPVEAYLNFTQKLDYLSEPGTFDNNSVRVYEFNETTGEIMQEIPSQFVKDVSYNESYNAYGKVIFTLNGTSLPDEVRSFYVYFDKMENGNKTPPSYQSEIPYTWSSGELEVNTTLPNGNNFTFRIDTSRGNSTSGLFEAFESEVGSKTFAFNPAGAGEKTLEYIEYTNGTYNFTYNLTEAITILDGPSALIFRQEGYEVFWDDHTNFTNETYIVKEYVFYKGMSWFLVRQNITNIAEYNITRNSTSAGALVFDIVRGYGSDYLTGASSEPGRWIRGTYVTGGPWTGYINLNQTGTTRFSADLFSANNRMGINLNSTMIEPNTSITHTAVVVLNTTNVNDQVLESLYDLLAYPVGITVYDSERTVVHVNASADHSIYNRNGSAIIIGNITLDPWNLTVYVNATLDNSTPADSTDDIVVQLYDDGTNGDDTANDGVYKGYYNLTDISNTGSWNVTIRAYTSNNYFLNESYFTFTVTSTYAVIVDIWNPSGLENREVNATVSVMNYRQDIYIPNSTLVCDYNGTNITDIRNHENGSWTIGLVAPDVYGLYIVTCNASKDGNNGTGTDYFNVESSETNMTIVNDPSDFIAYNVTTNNSQSFIINVTVNNYGNSSGSDTNISISLPAGWTSNSTTDYCGDVYISLSCTKSFNITIPALTSPGIYTINTTVVWKNFISTTSSNSTSTDVNVSSTYILGVPEEFISNHIVAGTSKIMGNFTVLSEGNDYLYNVTFNLTGGLPEFNVSFIPVNITSIAKGSNYSVAINVTVPSGYAPGLYNGTINISAANDGNDILILEVIVVGTNMNISNSPTSYTASNITASINESFLITVRADNYGNTTAYYNNITLQLPENWTSNSTLFDCGNLSRQTQCAVVFNVTIPELFFPGDYLVNSTVSWMDIGLEQKTNTTYTNVTVVSNKILNVVESNFSYTLSDGQVRELGNFTVVSQGNNHLFNITFNASSEFENMTFSFYPQNISSLYAGSNNTILFNVTIPHGHTPGEYNGTINVSAQDYVYDTINISITIPSNGTWYIFPESCEKVQSPQSGTVCSILINNTGNILLNFNINPASANFSTVNETSFSIDKQESHVISVTYDVTGQEIIFYNSTYTIDAIESQAYPDNDTFLIILNPFVTPLLNSSVSPNSTVQGGSVYIEGNVTTQSGNAISYVQLNVTNPLGQSYYQNMSLVYEYGAETRWEAYYPSGWGNISRSGNYTVIFLIVDNQSVNGSYTELLQIYKQMNIELYTGSSQYAQAGSGTIYYRAKDYNNEPLENVSTAIILSTPLDFNITVSNSNGTTNSNGWLLPTPTFSLLSDAETGSYTLQSYSEYYDETIERTLNKTNTTTFDVLSSVSTGIISDIDTTVVWYPSSTMTFLINIYDLSYSPVDPDELNLTVYTGSPLLNNVYLNLDINNIIVQKNSVGEYFISYVMPSNTSSGDYYAILNARKGSMYTRSVKPFRVSQGGPYDLIINLGQSEVEQGQYLPFGLYIDNNGDFGQDVDVEWWVTDTSNTTYWDSSSFPTYTPSQDSVTVSQQAFIFSNQPVGFYTLHARMSYSTVQPPKYSNATFYVKEPSNETGGGEPGGGGVTGGGEGGEKGGGGGGGGDEPSVEKEKKYSVEIVDYPMFDATVESGKSRIVNIEVKNTGSLDLTDLVFSISGIPQSWYSYDPSVIRSLKANESAFITLKINVPNGTEGGSRSVKISIGNDDAEDEKGFSVIIFTSRKDLIEFELARLEARLLELKKKTEKAEEEEMNVEALKSKLIEIEDEIVIARDYFVTEKYDASLTHIANAWDLIKEATNILNNLKSKEEAPLIPLWLLIIIIVFVVVVILLVLFIKKLSSSFKLLATGRATETKDVSKYMQKNINKDQWLKEKGKHERMIQLLETQFKQGIISQAAYETMKKRTEERMKEIEKKLLQ